MCAHPAIADQPPPREPQDAATSPSSRQQPTAESRTRARILHSTAQKHTHPTIPGHAPPHKPGGAATSPNPPTPSNRRITDLDVHLPQHRTEASASCDARPNVIAGTQKCGSIPRSPPTPRPRNPGVVHASCATSHRSGRIPLSLISRRHGNPKIRRLLTIPAKHEQRTHESGRASRTT